MRNKLTLRDVASPILLKYAEVLGWEEATPIDIQAELEVSRLIISRHSPWCCICGGGNFRYMIHVGDKNICERCASDIDKAHKKYLYYKIKKE